MTLNLSTPFFSSRLLPHPHYSSSSVLTKFSPTCPNNNAPFPTLSFLAFTLPFPPRPLNAKSSVSESRNETSSDDTVSGSDQFDRQLLQRIAVTAKDADEALQMIADNAAATSEGGVVSTSDCCSIISAALSRNNPQLALSVFYAMWISFHQVGENGSIVERWKWPRPNAHVYTVLVQGLAVSLRVPDALTVIKYICEVGVSPGEEVPFGIASCRIAVAVAQSQQGIQEFFTRDHDRNSSSYSRRLVIITSLSFLAAATVIAASVATAAGAIREPETLSNIPQTLSSGDCKKPKIQKPKSRKAESCTVKCVNTCIRGGEGEGPLNIRRPLVVFKQGFRSRQYCLVECSDICNLIGDADDGP
ncbi:uncharacterized protein LOC130742404 isoform X2 [Lotus japonicus]|uniref:uncharacterized protein LOC130742404 isoform X2 n=1 Tax=Lotus japonicus TaxID=34305 RepID=UPI00258ED386|nr:uncharacterized protein LOC130742404 isoform X2 [Lotus japonicus]